MTEDRKKRKRPRDVVGNAITVAKIATGEIEEEEQDDDSKDKAGGRVGLTTAADYA